MDRATCQATPRCCAAWLTTEPRGPTGPDAETLLTEVSTMDGPCPSHKGETGRAV